MVSLRARSVCFSYASVSALHVQLYQRDETQTQKHITPTILYAVVALRSILKVLVPYLSVLARR